MSLRIPVFMGPGESGVIDLERGGGGRMRVRCTSVAVGAKAFVRGGAIEREAPALPDVVIEV